MVSARFAAVNEDVGGLAVVIEAREAVRYFSIDVGTEQVEGMSCILLG